MLLWSDLAIQSQVKMTRANLLLLFVLQYSHDCRALQIRAPMMHSVALCSRGSQSSIVCLDNEAAANEEPASQPAAAVEAAALTDKPAPVETVATVPPEPDEAGFFAGFGAAAGVFASPIVCFSLYNVAATGGGLDPGPYGLLGAVEGVSFLVVVSIVGAALVSKVSKGSGLPAGPLGLLGLSEGLSFLSVLGALLVFPLKELGVLGNPETAMVNVPATAAAINTVVGPLISSAVEEISAAVSAVLSGDGVDGLPSASSVNFSSILSSIKLPDVTLPEVKLPEGVPSMPEGLSIPAVSLPDVKLPPLPEGMTLPEIKLPENLPDLQTESAD